MTFVLPKLAYAYDALEPYISQEIMTLHHTKHHQGYVTNLNAVTLKLQQTNSIEETLSLQQTLKFNGGGFVNHNLFFANLAPKSNGGGVLGGQLVNSLTSAFGSIENFKTKFNAAAAGVQGSGWAWLGFKDGLFEIVTTMNQDPLLTHVPILGIDVWEHAYYLQYKNVRPDYLKAIWEVIDWKVCEARAQAAGAFNKSVL